MGSSIQTLVFPLINSYSRPFFDCRINQIFVRFLYDSGARMPVWCNGIEKFMAAFPDAKKIECECRISGFGEGIESADVYLISKFVLDSETGKFVIERLVIAMLPKSHIGCDFLISETMFSKVDSFIFRREKKELWLIGEDRAFQCTARRKGNEVLDITVWSQEIPIPI